MAFECTTSSLVAPNDLRFSCGRIVRIAEFYVPLSTIGDQHPSGARDRSARQLQAWVRPQRLPNRPRYRSSNSFRNTPRQWVRPGSVNTRNTASEKATPCTMTSLSWATPRAASNAG
jgi:hypothetical protein